MLTDGLCRSHPREGDYGGAGFLLMREMGECGHGCFRNEITACEVVVLCILTLER